MYSIDGINMVYGHPGQLLETPFGPVWIIAHTSQRVTIYQNTDQVLTINRIAYNVTASYELDASGNWNWKLERLKFNDWRRDGYISDAASRKFHETIPAVALKWIKDHPEYLKAGDFCVLSHNHREKVSQKAKLEADYTIVCREIDDLSKQINEFE